MMTNNPSSPTPLEVQAACERLTTDIDDKPDYDGVSVSAVDLSIVLSALTQSHARIAELEGALSKFRSLLNPVWMSVVERAMVDDPVADTTIIFSFMGSGASDRTTMAEFRAAMGDEREVVANTLLNSDGESK